jgi:hypothetical protein
MGLRALMAAAAAEQTLLVTVRAARSVLRVQLPDQQLLEAGADLQQDQQGQRKRRILEQGLQVEHQAAEAAIQEPSLLLIHQLIKRCHWEPV